MAAFGQRLNTKHGGSRIDKRLNADLVKAHKARGWRPATKACNKMIKLKRLMLNHCHSSRVFYCYGVNWMETACILRSKS